MAGLTARELEVLELMLGGVSSQRAADILSVSKRTIDFHVSNIYDKWGVHNRIEMYRKSDELGLLARKEPK